VLPEASYADVFRTGVIDAALAEELKRRRARKRDVGHIDAAVGAGFAEEAKAT
jgi:hypothetical protein